MRVCRVVVILRLPEALEREARNAGGRRRISSFPSCVESQGVSAGVAHLEFLRRPPALRASRSMPPAAQDDNHCGGCLYVPCIGDFGSTISTLLRVRSMDIIAPRRSPVGAVTVAGAPVR